MTIGKGSKVLKVSKVLAARGAPLFAKNEYRLKSAVDALLEVSQSGASTNFKFLVWTEDKKGFTQYPVGRRIEEIEYGYSSKEEAFFTQCVERGDRWRLETATDYASLRDHLRNNRFNALVIIGESPIGLALKAVHYLEKIEAGPKTVILGFHNRTLDPSDFYRVWCYLRSCGRLHLLRNFAYLLSSPLNRQYLPVIYEREISDLTVPIWEVDPGSINEKHILRLFTERVEEGQRIDYKQAKTIADKPSTKRLFKDFCAMANSGGGVILVGIKEIDGRPLDPLRLGLQNVSKPDQQINRLTQMLTSEFGNLGPPKEIRSIEVMKKNVVLIKIFPTVTGFLRPREGKFAEKEYPFREGRITVWRSPSD